MCKKYILIVATLIMLLSSGCSDWLDLSPKNKLTGKDYWQTKEEVLSAVAGIYASLEDDNNYSKFFVWGELRGEFAVVNPSGSTGNTNNPGKIINGQILPDNSLFDWTAIYTTINLCNTLLESAPKVLKTDPTFSKNQLLSYQAEALTVRSLMYFLLVRSFGDVPLVLEATTSDDQNFYMPKTDQNVILDTLQADLNKALLNIPDSYSTLREAKGRVTKYAVYALLADISLWRNDYDNCIGACDVIINSKQFSLEPSSTWRKNMFYVANSNSSIFELQFDNDGGKSNKFYSWFHSSGSAKTYLANMEYILNSFFWGDVDGVDCRGVNGSYNSAGLIYKFLGDESDNGGLIGSNESYEHWIYYRYADALLMKAEALIEKKDSASVVEALLLINEVRTNAGSAVESADLNDLSSLEKLVMDEKAREFAFEGKRWFDVMRMYLRNDVANGHSTDGILLDMIVNKTGGGAIQEELEAKYKDKRSLYNPIFTDELNANKALKQNSYYQ